MRRIILNNRKKRVNSTNKINGMPHRGQFPFQRFERKLIRIMVVLTVLLGLFQFKTFTDPVTFYLKLSGELDTPAFKYDDQTGTIMLTFQVSPEADIVLRQNNEDIGIIKDNKTALVQPGTVFLDATGVSYPVTVDIVLNSQHYPIQLDGDVKSFEVKLKSGV